MSVIYAGTTSYAVPTYPTYGSSSQSVNSSSTPTTSATIRPATTSSVTPSSSSTYYQTYSSSNSVSPVNSYTTYTSSGTLSTISNPSSSSSYYHTYSSSTSVSSSNVVRLTNTYTTYTSSGTIAAALTPNSSSTFYPTVSSSNSVSSSSVVRSTSSNTIYTSSGTLTTIANPSSSSTYYQTYSSSNTVNTSSLSIAMMSNPSSSSTYYSSIPSQFNISAVAYSSTSVTSRYIEKDTDNGTETYFVTNDGKKLKVNRDNLNNLMNQYMHSNSEDAYYLSEGEVLYESDKFGERVPNFLRFVLSQNMDPRTFNYVEPYNRGDAEHTSFIRQREAAAENYQEAYLQQIWGRDLFLGIDKGVEKGFRTTVFLVTNPDEVVKGVVDYYIDLYNEAGKFAKDPKNYIVDKWGSMQNAYNNFMKLSPNQKAQLIGEMLGENAVYAALGAGAGSAGAKALTVVVKNAKPAVDKAISAIEHQLKSYESERKTGPGYDLPIDEFDDKDIYDRWTPRTVSNDRLLHASRGDFNTNNRMTGGGHGQESIDYLNKSGIEFNIVKEYANGVRIGNIPNHLEKYKRTGEIMSWFPENWTRTNIKNAGEYIANLEENRGKGTGNTIENLYGVYNGVRVVVAMKNGEIHSIFPDRKEQPSPILSPVQNTPKKQVDNSSNNSNNNSSKSPNSSIIGAGTGVAYTVGLGSTTSTQQAITNDTKLKTDASFRESEIERTNSVIEYRQSQGLGTSLQEKYLDKVEEIQKSYTVGNGTTATKEQAKSNDNRARTDEAYRQAELERAKSVIEYRKSQGLDVSSQVNYLNKLKNM